MPPHQQRRAPPSRAHHVIARVLRATVIDAPVAVVPCVDTQVNDVSPNVSGVHDAREHRIGRSMATWGVGGPGEERFSASGATPMIPKPLSPAAMIPATCVPWSTVLDGIRTDIPRLAGHEGPGEYDIHIGCKIGMGRVYSCVKHGHADVRRPRCPVAHACGASIASRPHWPTK